MLRNDWRRSESATGSPSESTNRGIDSSSARSRPAGVGREERPVARPRPCPSVSSGRGQPSWEPAAATGGDASSGKSPEVGEAVASPERAEAASEPARSEPRPDSECSPALGAEGVRRSTAGGCCVPKRSLRALRAEGDSSGRSMPPGRGSSSAMGEYSGDTSTGTATSSTSIPSRRGGPGGCAGALGSRSRGGGGAAGSRGAPCHIPLPGCIPGKNCPAGDLKPRDCVGFPGILDFAPSPCLGTCPTVPRRGGPRGRA